MSSNIVGRVDDMGKNIFINNYQGKKIDDIEKSINDLMNDIGVDEVDLEKDN